MTDKPQRPTAEEFETWLRPAEATALLSHLDMLVARRTLLTRFQHEQIFASAGTGSWMEGSERKEARFAILNKKWWRSVSSTFALHDFWTSGDITFEIQRGRIEETILTCFDVRFEPTAIRAMSQPRPTSGAPQALHVPPAPLASAAPLATPAPIAPATSASANPRNAGRKPKEWWDDLWIEIFRQVWLGELKPKRQADIEKAMLDWAAKEGHELSLSSARPSARKLFTLIERLDNN